MRAGGRGYRQAGRRNPASEENRETTVVNVQGEPVFDDVIRVSESAIPLTDLLSDDGGHSHGLRGWRLA